MKIDKDKPYVIFLAEIIYKNVTNIKKKNPAFVNIDAIERFMVTETYEEISSGKFHDIWFKKLESNQFIDEKTGKKIPDETIQLLKIQKDMAMKQLIKYPKLYYVKSSFPLEISQRAFDFLWRMCESYELWCKETKQPYALSLKITD